MNQAAADAARDFAHGIADYWQEKLGDRLLGIYLIGSLAHGGYSARYSDIDLGLISNDGLAPTEIEAMRTHARDVAPELASRLSLFWSDRGFNIGRFPPLDRLDYLDRAQLLIEHEPSLRRPTRRLRRCRPARWTRC